MEKVFHLYSVCFRSDAEKVERVVLLHATDEQDALYCIEECYGQVSHAEVIPLDSLQIGVMVSVYERKIE